MILKMMKPRTYKEGDDGQTVRYLLDTHSFVSHTLEHENLEEYSAVFNEFPMLQGGYMAPFTTHPVIEKDGTVTGYKPGKISIIIPEGHMPVIAEGCTVYVMNDDGKTVDTIYC